MSQNIVTPSAEHDSPVHQLTMSGGGGTGRAGAGSDTDDTDGVRVAEATSAADQQPHNQRAAGAADLGDSGADQREHSTSAAAAALAEGAGCATSAVPTRPPPTTTETSETADGAADTDDDTVASTATTTKTITTTSTAMPPPPMTPSQHTRTPLKKPNLLYHYLRIIFEHCKVIHCYHPVLVLLPLAFVGIIASNWVCAVLFPNVVTGNYRTYTHTRPLTMLTCR